MRKASINPCERKGELVAARARENAFQTGARRRYGACECASAIRCAGKSGERLRYAMDTEDGSLRNLLNPKYPRPNSISVVPCSEQFREHDSKGTKLYRQIVGAATNFQGCQAVEEFLIREKLVRPWIHDRETLGLADLLDKVVPMEDEYSLPLASETLSTFREAFSRADDVGVDENHWRVNRISQNIQFKINNTFKDMVSTPPGSFRQSHARTLYEDGLFRKEDGKRAALFLISKGITDQETVQQLLPSIPYEKYKSYEGSAYAAIEATLPKRARIFKQFLESLTPKQRKAIDLLYLRNNEGLSQRRVAEILGISVDSLISRLQGAKKKLLDDFPELKPVRRKSAPRLATAISPEGKQARSEEKEMVVVQIDPKTGTRTELRVPKSPKGRIRMKPGVDRAEIRIRIAIMCPIPFPVG